jgi:hypothetical protein
VQVRSSPNERTAGALLGRIGLLRRVVAIAITLTIACRPGVATPRPRRPLPPSPNDTLSQTRLEPLTWRVVHGGCAPGSVGLTAP